MEPRKLPADVDGISETGSFTDDYLLYLLAQASATASDAFHEKLAADGLSVSTWRILGSLYPNKRLNVGMLAHECLMKQPTLTRTLDRLVNAGLVHRLHSATDRRGVLVELTEEGRDVASENVLKAKAQEAHVTRDYSSTEVAELKNMLRELIRRSLEK